MKYKIGTILICIALLSSIILITTGQMKEETKTLAKTDIVEEVSIEITENKSDETPRFEKEDYKKFDDSQIENVTFKRTVSVLAVGDIMAHTLQFTAAYDKQTDQYNFYEQFKYIADKLSSKDFAIGNLETVFAGKDRRYSGKNMIFNAPDNLAESIKKAGIDILTTSNNHSLDRGFDGISRTIDVLDELEILHTGTFKTEEESNEILIFEKEGISFALLSYSYSTNGWPMPEGKPYSMNMMEEQKIIGDIKKAKEAGADIVMVGLHWGLEYRSDPNHHQTNLADSLFYAGADIILGSHPHVLQPFEHLTMVDESGTKKEKFIIYSMGNFISGQRTSPRDIGMYINFKISRIGSEPAFIEEVSVMPTWVQATTVSGKGYMRILDIHDTIIKYDQDLIENISRAEYEKLKRVEAESIEHLFKNTEYVEYLLNDENEYVIYLKRTPE